MTATLLLGVRCCNSTHNCHATASAQWHLFSSIVNHGVNRMQDPLPPGTVVGPGKPCGKELIPDPHQNSSKPEHVDMYKLMTYQPLSEVESSR